ncbi:hypothetical protein HOLleu_11611 [Holothuria leucospilota]|uniref:Uncharacterized protein n=1 Tax=Holothuria leucospilota TaxID=206669 RepID=A0A9Q1HCF5_HOLLE|nr:hypothetical protein HOLleu_11611 [Holothuria leucospilota]
MEGSHGNDQWNESSSKGYRGRLLSVTGQIVVGLVFVVTFVLHAITYGTIDNQLGNFLFGFFIISTGLMGAGRMPRTSEIIAYVVASLLTSGVLGFLFITRLMDLISLIMTDQTGNDSLSEGIVNLIVYVSGIIFSIVGTVFACLTFCE